MYLGSVRRGSRMKFCDIENRYGLYCFRVSSSHSNALSYSPRVIFR